MALAQGSPKNLYMAPCSKCLETPALNLSNIAPFIFKKSSEDPKKASIKFVRHWTSPRNRLPSGRVVESQKFFRTVTLPITNFLTLSVQNFLTATPTQKHLKKRLRIHSKTYDSTTLISHTFKILMKKGKVDSL